MSDKEVRPNDHVMKMGLTINSDTRGVLKEEISIILKYLGNGSLGWGYIFRF